MAVAAAFLLFDQLRDHGVSREHEAGDRCRVLQRGASDLGRVDHAHLDQVAELLGLRVEAEVTLVLEHLVEHHRGLRTGVVDDDAQRLFERFHHDLNAGLLVVVVALELAFQHLLGADESHTAARDDALFDRRAGGVQRVLDAGLLLLHLDLGGSADLDNRHAAGELRHALLQLLLVVIAGRLFDLHADLLDASLDQPLVARAVDDGGVLLRRLDLLRLAEVLQRRVLELEAQLLADHGAAREDGHVFEHRLAAVTEARRLHQQSREARSSSFSSDLPSSTVITPSLPTLSIASEMILPMSKSAFAEMAPTWAISFVVVQGLEIFFSSSTTATTALSMPRFRSIGFMPEATNFMPSRTMAWARTVAVVVPSPATSEVLEATSFTICAPMFSNLSFSSISLATETPSLVTVGAPNERSSTTLRPLGPSVTFTASARMFSPWTILERAPSWKRTSLAGIAVSPSSKLSGCLTRLR